MLAQLVCPQPTQPHITSGSCRYGISTTVYTGPGDQLTGTAQGLTPYATYQFFLLVANSNSSQHSSPSIFYTTDSAGNIFLFCLLFFFEIMICNRLVQCPFRPNIF